jgi:hypothetical protein
MNFVMETLEWIQLALLTNYKIFRVDVNNVIVRRSSGIVADIVCPILTKFGFFYIYSKASDIKFRCNPSSNGSRERNIGPDVRTDGHKEAKIQVFRLCERL